MGNQSTYTDLYLPNIRTLLRKKIGTQQKCWVKFAINQINKKKIAIRYKTKKKENNATHYLMRDHSMIKKHFHHNQSSYEGKFK